MFDRLAAHMRGLTSPEPRGAPRAEPGAGVGAGGVAAAAERFVDAPLGAAAASKPSSARRPRIAAASGARAERTGESDMREFDTMLTRLVKRGAPILPHVAPNGPCSNHRAQF